MISMTREQATTEVKKHLTDYLNMITTTKGKKYICPICKSGTGKNGTPAGSVKDDRFSCFSCGNTSLDIIDLIFIIENKKTKAEAFQRAYELFGLSIDTKIKSNTQIFKKSETVENYNDVDLNDFFSQANKTLLTSEEALDYIHNRGINDYIIEQFNIGFCPIWKHPNSPNMMATKRIIIPTGKMSYVARDIDPFGNKSYKVMKMGKSEIFNKDVLFGDDKSVVFVTEGEFDALSIIQAGENAIALGSVNNINKLTGLLKEKQTQKLLILCLDNDEVGQKAQKKLADCLDELNVKYIEKNISEKYKDANEFLQKDSNGFYQSINIIVKDAEDIQETEKELMRKEYYKNNAYNHIGDFLNGIAASVNTKAIPTGFNNLDKTLDGGLFEGLYIIGAISSLGKTTFVLQMADQIASFGEDVLIFSLEMARTELMAKSISRLTYQECDGNTKNAKTTRGITCGERFANYSFEENQIIKKSIDKYETYARHLYINEGLGNIGTEQIKKAVKTHMEITGRKPVVIIDYLQIIAPADIRCTDKQNIDKAVFELKRISRDFKIPVIGISSLNRDSYTKKISMQAFKESGAIEYSSDILIGLQFQNNKELNEDVIDSEKSKHTRKIELKILKNRNGKTGSQICFDYIPMFNFFAESGESENDDIFSEETFSAKKGKIIY